MGSPFSLRAISTASDGKPLQRSITSFQISLQGRPYILWETLSLARDSRDPKHLKYDDKMLHTSLELLVGALCDKLRMFIKLKGTVFCGISLSKSFSCSTRSSCEFLGLEEWPFLISSSMSSSLSRSSKLSVPMERWWLSFARCPFS